SRPPRDRLPSPRLTAGLLPSATDSSLPPLCNSTILFPEGLSPLLPPLTLISPAPPPASTADRRAVPPRLALFNRRPSRRPASCPRRRRRVIPPPQN
ncbi:Os11g0429200, partial [Oryza sativa Japonica Group]